MDFALAGSVTSLTWASWGIDHGIAHSHARKGIDHNLIAQRFPEIKRTAIETRGSDFVLLSDDDWHDRFAAKLHGTVQINRTVWPQVIEARDPIVNVIVANSQVVEPDSTITGAVNAVTKSFTKSLSVIRHHTGVRLKGVIPSVVKPHRVHANLERQTHDLGLMPADALHLYLITIPQKRLRQAEEYAL